MSKRTIFLIALVVFFPLNHLPTYANETNMATASKIPTDYLFDIEKTNPNENLINNYLDCFSYVSADAMKYALSGYAALNNNGKILKKDILTIVDFSKPSTEERLFVINLKTKQVIAKSLVAHGRNSGEIWASKFSNKAESYQSSLGFYICNETYEGKNGFSLRLDGQETGINDKARDRGVVIHGADYVSKQFIANNGKLGRSQGCPALPLEKNEQIISLLKGGSCLFIYHPNTFYKTHSTILKNYSESSLAEVVTELGE